MTRSFCVVLALALLVQPATAQRAPARGSSTGTPSSTAVRAELAALLLHSKRYDEAAREYQALLNRAPANDEYRLGLARALAWGKRPREAERHLRVLKARRPTNYEIDDFLRSVRESFEPTSGEATSWVAEQPRYAPYRLALARALVREGNARAALPHYEMLMANNSSPALRREAVDAQISAGDYARAADRLRIAVLRTPADSAARHSLARLLIAAQQYDEGLAHYDSLVAWYPTSGVLIERAQVHMTRRDLAAAEKDAVASLYGRQTAEAYLLLSTIQRLRGDWDEARVSLHRAGMLGVEPRDRDAALAQLARDERPIVAFLPGWDESAGWAARSSATTDNLGLLYTTLGVRGIQEFPNGFSGSIDAELRRIAQPAPGVSGQVIGTSFDVGLANEFDYGPLLMRIGARAGLAHQAGQSLPTFGLAASGWFKAWGISLEHVSAPAYPELLSVSAIEVPDSDEDPLSERSTSIALGGPLGVADLALYGQRAEISDGNLRTTMQAVLRLPLSTHVTALTGVTGIRFTERSTLYWDPLTYWSGAAGLELAARQPRGVSAAIRVLAGPARSVEEVRVSRFRTDEVEHSVLQLGAGADLSYRSESAELGAALNYGNGRAGDYRRLEAALYVRQHR
jgi:tetratricopeptide (TPR) repeat protein